MAHPLLLHARRVLHAHLFGGVPPSPPDPWWAQPARGCFVSLKIDGRLRGCVGTVLPTRATLGEEVAENALASALRDPRFTPLEARELEHVRFSIDLLSAPQPAASAAELDAARYGVLVRAGPRLGVLLPDIPGVRTPEQQIAICLEKAGIAPGEPYSLERFEVERLSE